MEGRIHSFQSLGTLDGPGVRFVAFLQGCPLRCKCCHNPDTWEIDAGEIFTAEAVAAKASRFKSYFGKLGGVTLSGGEPLLQAAFCEEVFRLCHAQGINTCLDTSGCLLTDSVKELLTVADRVLLDIKYVSDEQYRQNVGCSLTGPVTFLRYLNEQRIPTVLRQVIIPGLNDNEESVIELKHLADSHPCVDKVELLPFRKICETKYDMMGMEFPLKNVPEPDKAMMEKLNQLLV